MILYIAIYTHRDPIVAIYGWESCIDVSYAELNSKYSMYNNSVHVSLCVANKM